MKVFRLEVKQLEVTHEIIYDHQEFTNKLEEVTLYDATNYPYTINPKKYFDLVKKGVIQNQQEFKVTPQKLMQFKHFDFFFQTF